MKTIEELDVRSLIPIERHKKLKKIFKELPVDESFIFINDHDPKPLYYEFRSIYGNVVGWEYLNKDPMEWKVQVTRTDPSKGRKYEGASTLMDLTVVKKKDWKHAVFHRYGMMQEGDTMELSSEEDPVEIRTIFENKFADEHTWVYKKQDDNEHIIHITKNKRSDLDDYDILIVKKFDVRSYPPAKRHEMVFESFDELKPGEAFVFINDHDPKPLYYQMEAESSEPFEWQYLEVMPEEWKVKIMKIENEKE